MREALSIERLRKDGESFNEELSREFYESLSGLKAEAQIQPLYEKYRAIFSDDSLELTREAFLGSAEGTEERRSARLLLDWQVESHSSRQLASLDEREIAWEGEAVVQLSDGRQIPYQRTSIELGNSTDRHERAMIEAARAKLVEKELAPMKKERFQRERDITEAIGVANGYNATWELLSGISLSDLRAECEAFLRDTQAMWDDIAPRVAKRVLGMPLKETTRADALALFRAREFDEYFPAREMESAIRRQVTEMGIDPEANGRIILDTGDREGKRSRAFCSPVRVPDEVYLVLRPHGGQTDWNTFLHELGHALHYAYMRPDLAFEYRWLGDNSITEGYAMLFDHRMKDTNWLKRYTELGPSRISPYLRKAGLEEFHFLRRYCAKLIYETDLYGGGRPRGPLTGLYCEALPEAA